MDRGVVRKRIESAVRRVYNAATEDNLHDNFILLGQNGLFDSVAALQLVLAVEEEFGIIVEDEDISPENLKSLDCLTRFVERKLSRSQRP